MRPFHNHSTNFLVHMTQIAPANGGNEVDKLDKEKRNIDHNGVIQHRKPNEIFHIDESNSTVNQGNLYRKGKQKRAMIN